MVENVRENAEPRLLPNGKLYCVEDAVTEEDHDACALDLEESLWLAEDDKRRMLRTVEQAARRLELARNPCNWFEKLRRADRCK